MYLGAHKCIWSPFLGLAFGVSAYEGQNPKADEEEIPMFLTVFVVLLVMWLLGLFAFHVAGGLIHLLLVIAVISLVVHLFRGRGIA